MEFARIVRPCLLAVLIVCIGGAGVRVAAVETGETAVRSLSNRIGENGSLSGGVHVVKAETDVPAHTVPVPMRALEQSWTFRHTLVAAGVLGGVILLLLGFVVVFRCRISNRGGIRAKEDKDGREAAEYREGQSLADLSHELRTPMNSILGMIGLALKTTHADERTEYLRIAQQSAESLQGLIDDIEDLSRLSVGNIELDAVEFSLRKHLTRILNVLAIRAHKKGVELACRIAPEVPDRLIGDPGRLRQVLTNLVDNAIKFTEEGEVVLDVERLSGAAGAVDLRFAVSDTGIGIPESQRHRIFEKFGQVDNAVTQEHEGAGLGLNIASQLVQKMGGKLDVASILYEGSMFHFTITLQLADARCTALPGLSASLEGQRVLVLDPHDTSRTIIREIFEKWQLEIVEATNPADAVRQLNQAVSTDAFDLVFVDARTMTPDNTALYSILTELQRVSDVAVVLLSRASESERSTRSLDFTGDGLIMKPVTGYKVAMLLNEICEGRACAVPTSRETFNAAWGQPLRILLAEDDVVNQQLVVEILNKQNHEIEVVGDGSEAIAAHESGQYDLIFMDVHMPKVDGLEATRIIRARERRLDRTTPIVGITARAMEGDRRICLEAGMDGYVTKPIVPDQLFRSIGRAMSDSRGIVTLSSENGQGGDGRLASVDDVQIFNREKLELVFDEDIDYLKQFMESFLEICPEYMADVREAVNDQDRERLVLSAHRLHSSLEALHAESACQVAARLEQAARSRVLKDTSEIFERLEQEIEHLKRVLLDETVS